MKRSSARVPFVRRAKPEVIVPTKQQLRLPDEAFRLEEANLPAELALSLAGRMLMVEVLPEEPPASRQVEPDDFPLLIDPDGNYWNDYRPVRVLYRDSKGAMCGGSPEGG